MGATFHFSSLLVILIVIISIQSSDELQSSQAQALFRIQRLLNYPFVLRDWKEYTDFCTIEPNAFLTVVCYEESVTQLHIIGDPGVPPLAENFSMESFVTTLVKLPDLKVLTLASLGLWGRLPDKVSRLSSLEILNISSNYLHGSIPSEVSFLTGLQALVLDDNTFSGDLLHWVGTLPNLYVLSIKNNTMNGTLPHSLRRLENLRVLVLSHNRFSGEVPDLSSLTNLQVLDLGNNELGPQFPQLGNKLILLVLRNNNFTLGVPSEVLSSCYQLQRLDISSNRLMGPFPVPLLAMPLLSYLNISENKFTGMLFNNLSCSTSLESVDLSANYLTGRLPSCLLSGLKHKNVLYANNCLATREQNQNPFSFCRNQALAVGFLPSRKEKNRGSKTVLALSIVGGMLGCLVFAGLLFLAFRRVNGNNKNETPTKVLITENPLNVYTSKLLSEARYISQTRKLGALGLPAYRAFSLEELEEATNNFDTSMFMGEGFYGQMYKGQLKDGSSVAVRCLKMKKSHSTHNFMHHIELITKLRHLHLVSALGHCFECYLDDSSVSRVFLVFEFISNGTLRSWISDVNARQRLNWKQRIASAIGVAKGIQFLHTGIVPGVFSNNLKITDILLDHNLVPKISSYNLPLLADNMVKIGTGGLKAHNEDKVDVYDFGVILLEIIVGRPLVSENDVNVVKVQLQTSVTGDEASRKSTMDPRIRTSSSDESAKTMMELCLRCLIENPTQRPSVEDVLWNLQFAAQVQDTWQTDSISSESSPATRFPPPPASH